MPDYQDSEKKYTETEYQTLQRTIARLEAEKIDDFNDLQRERQSREDEKAKVVKIRADNDQLKHQVKFAEAERKRLQDLIETEHNTSEDLKRKESFAKQRAEDLKRVVDLLQTELSRMHQGEAFQIEDENGLRLENDEHAIKLAGLAHQLRLRDDFLESQHAELESHQPALHRLHQLHDALRHVLLPATGTDTDSDAEAEDIYSLDVQDISDRLQTLVARAHQSPIASTSSSPTKNRRPRFGLHSLSLQDEIPVDGSSEASSRASDADDEDANDDTLIPDPLSLGFVSGPRVDTVPTHGPRFTLSKILASSTAPQTPRLVATVLPTRVHPTAVVCILLLLLYTSYTSFACSRRHSAWMAANEPRSSQVFRRGDGAGAYLGRTYSDRASSCCSYPFCLDWLVRSGSDLLILMAGQLGYADESGMRLMC